jgi:hypothetical protein
MVKKQSGSEFAVKLAGLKLPAEIEKRIATEIRQAVLREIAKLDFKGDLRIRPGIKLGPGTLGIAIEMGNIPRGEL